MLPSPTYLPPVVRFFAGRSESFIRDGSCWRRMTLPEVATSNTGQDRDSREVHVGVSISRRPNGLMRVEFDLFRLGANLRPSIVERLRARWTEEASALSKMLQKSVNRRAHFSKTFAQFEVLPAHIEGWKSELESVLSDPNSYESN